jgi:hypothetical protein
MSVYVIAQGKIENRGLLDVSVPLAAPGTARGTGVGHGSSGHANDIDEQRTSSSISWRRAFQEPHVVGEIIAGELRVAKFNSLACSCASTVTPTSRLIISSSASNRIAGWRL